jgi:hypothetical protein
LLSNWGPPKPPTANTLSLSISKKAKKKKKMYGLTAVSQIKTEHFQPKTKAKPPISPTRRSTKRAPE